MYTIYTDLRPGNLEIIIEPLFEQTDKAWDKTTDWDALKDFDKPKQEEK